MAILERSKDNSPDKDRLNGQSAMDNDDGISDENFGKRIARLQEEYLLPLKEDLADWINSIMGMFNVIIILVIGLKLPRVCHYDVEMISSRLR